MIIQKAEIIWGLFSSVMFVESLVIYMFYPLYYRSTGWLNIKPINRWNTFSYFLMGWWGVAWGIWITKISFDNFGGTLHLIFLIVSQLVMLGPAFIYIIFELAIVFGYN